MVLLKTTYVFIVFLFLSNPVKAQGNWQWQDPADIGTIDLADKFLSLTNATAVLLSEVFSRADTSLEKSNRYYFSFYGEYQREYIKRSALSDVFMLKGRYGYQFKKWVSIGGEFQLYYFQNPEVRTPGIGFSTYYNWYIFNKKNWKLIFDNGAGAIATARAFPASGTKFNFNTFYGLSTQVILKDQNYLMLGVRNMHISNAFLFGDDRNPAFDSVGFLAGFRF